MRHGHLLAIYLLLFLVCFVQIHMEQIQYDRVIKEKQRLEEGLKNAVDAAVQRFIASQYENEAYQKEAVIDVFFDSLYLYLGIHSQKEEQEQLQMHIPMIVLAQEDGVCFYYATQIQEKEQTILQYGWGETIPYNTNTSEEEIISKAVVANIIEKKASEIISQYNVIASQMGIEYEFFVPKFLGNTATQLEFPMIFVVFQGWPLTASGNVFYDSCIDAGASIHRKNKYVVEVPDSLSDTYSYFHVPGCSELGTKGRVLEGQWFSKEEAIKQYGAVPCTVCGK